MKFGRQIRFGNKESRLTHKALLKYKPQIIVRFISSKGILERFFTVDPNLSVLISD